MISSSVASSDQLEDGGPWRIVRMIHHLAEMLENVRLPDIHIPCSRGFPLLPPEWPVIPAVDVMRHARFNLC